MLQADEMAAADSERIKSLPILEQSELRGYSAKNNFLKNRAGLASVKSGEVLEPQEVITSGIINILILIPYPQRIRTIMSMV